MTLASAIILTGSLMLFALAGYWLIRATRAESKMASSRLNATLALRRAIIAEGRLDRIIALETPGMAHVGKKAVAIARGER